MSIFKLTALTKLEDTARYAGLLLTPAEGFGRGFFCPLGKKRAFYAWPIFDNFWCPVVTMVTFSSNLSNFERNQIKTKKSKKNSKKSKNQKIKKKIKKS